MINKRNKMYQTNFKIRKWLVENGYKDIHFFVHTRFIKDLHFQGLEFDGLASIDTTLVLFQCKTNCKPTKKKMQEYRQVSKKYGISCIWINCVDRKGVEIYK
jgi:citrate lyase synthetase